MKDLLDDILDTLGLQGALYFRTDFSPPWAVTVPELEQAARFHLVVQGRCHVTFPSGAAVELGPGDLVLIPRGRSHVLADQPGREAPSLESVLADVGYDGRGVFAGLPDPFEATRYHSLVVARDEVPDCLEVTAWTEDAEGGRDEIMGLRHRELEVEGVQFHPESILTRHGHDLLANFLARAAKWPEEAPA